jgi:hypothetical protein
MINWIIITIAVCILIEVMIALGKYINTNDNYYKLLTKKFNDIKLIKSRSLENQIQHINIKKELNKYNGNMWFNLFFSIIILNVVAANIKDNVNFFLIIVFYTLASASYALFQKNFIYSFFKQLSIFSFMVIIILFFLYDPLYLFNYRINFLLLLPYLLLIKIMYNNMRLNIYERFIKNRTDNAKE